MSSGRRQGGNIPPKCNPNATSAISVPSLSVGLLFHPLESWHLASSAAQEVQQRSSPSSPTLASCLLCKVSPLIFVFSLQEQSFETQARSAATYLAGAPRVPAHPTVTSAAQAAALAVCH